MARQERFFEKYSLFASFACPAKALATEGGFAVNDCFWTKVN
jgi:hypothetical protein